jgi:hypothetical protein
MNHNIQEAPEFFGAFSFKEAVKINSNIPALDQPTIFYIYTSKISSVQSNKCVKFLFFEEEK